MRTYGPAVVVDVEDSMPYEPVLSDLQVALQTLEELRKSYESDATSFRLAKQYPYAADSSMIALALLSAGRTADPLTGIRNKIGSLSYQINELRWVMSEVKKNVQANKKKEGK